MSTTQTYTAFALDSTVPAGPHDGGDDDWAVVPGITVEINDAEGREVAGKGVSWPDGKFNSGLADQTLGQMGFRRTGPWEWHNWDWRAPLVAAKDSTG